MRKLLIVIIGLTVWLHPVHADVEMPADLPTIEALISLHKMMKAEEDKAMEKIGVSFGEQSVVTKGEEELKKWFYDLQVDNPKEYERRVQLLYEKEHIAIKEQRVCENKIRVLKKDEGWNEKYEMLYQRYIRSELSMEMGFVKYLEKHGNLTQTGWILVLKSMVPGSLANKIAILSEELVALKQRVRDAHHAKLYESGRYSFL